MTFDDARDVFPWFAWKGTVHKITIAVVIDPHIQQGRFGNCDVHGHQKSGDEWTAKNDSILIIGAGDIIAQCLRLRLAIDFSLGQWTERWPALDQRVLGPAGCVHSRI